MTQCITRSAVIVAWIGALLGCAWWQLGYELAPGASATCQSAAPYGALRAQPDRPLVVMALHPRCPCSRASVSNLEAGLTAWGADVQVRVLGVVPAGVDPGPEWTASGVCRRAAGLGEGVLLEDDGGVIAGSLGMRTSGDVVAFDARGRVVFHGGLTTARGQAGPSEGVRLLIAALRSDGARPALTTPVFGCVLGAAPPEGDGCGDAPP
jgi:hypothetical protein